MWNLSNSGPHVLGDLPACVLAVLGWVQTLIVAHHHTSVCPTNGAADAIEGTYIPF